MTRQLRIEFPGATYHITSRGNAQNLIFIDDEDRELFQSGLDEVVTRFGWLCHAYCLMDNHYHLLIETPRGNLSLGMRQLNGVYTQRFNRRHDRIGHVFQGRFKAIVVDRDNYLLELCCYVVLNPIRTGTVEKIEHYAWSSYPATVGLVGCPPWLETAWVLGQFAKARATARRRYAEFVAEGIRLPSPWPALRGQVLLGLDAFVEKIHPLLEQARNSKEIPRTQRFLHRPSLTSLFINVAPSDITLRNTIIRKAFFDYGFSMAAISRHIKIHYSTVSRIIKKIS